MLSPADRELIGGRQGVHRGVRIIQHQTGLHAQPDRADDQRHEDQQLATVDVGDGLQGRVGDLDEAQVAAVLVDSVRA